ncbi:MAG: hypothetical protein AAGJ29_04950 [Pseudomonadota bacterium]
MLTGLHVILTGISLLCLGVGIGAGWICTIVAPNVFYDKLDASRANTQVRSLIYTGATPVAGVLLAAGACAILAGAFGAGTLSLFAAIGFFLNRWTLAPHKRGEAPKGIRRRRTGQRMVAVGISLGSLALSLVAAGLVLFGV